MLFLGLDVGSSSLKASVIDGDSGRCLAATHYPESELHIASPRVGWAEQDPETWWDCAQQACAKLIASGSFNPLDIAAIGISYQMHGLVLVDKAHKPLRPAIIWCDSRAVACGEQGLQVLGADYCFDHLLNSPGNFTAAKLRWVQQNEADIYGRIHKAMLPGDYLALCLTGEINSTPSGMSEGTLWDFDQRSLATELLSAWGIDSNLLPELRPNIGLQSSLSASAAQTLGLNAGIPVSYRAGDQPNNALSLNVFEPGEVAATAGTSGVIYGVTDQKAADRQSRVNTFLHVNDRKDAPRNGVLVCVNGTGRLYSWLRSILTVDGQGPSYPQLNALAEQVAVGSEGLVFHPFGNGAERIFQNRNPGAQLLQIDLNRHSLGHIVRAAQEGIVFALNQGFAVLKELGGSCEVVKVGQGNMFLSDVFAQTFVNTTQAAVEVFATDGAEGAARGAALGCGFYRSTQEAFAGLQRLHCIEPDPRHFSAYEDAYQSWQAKLPL